jgi:DNA modification methylase
LLPRPYYTDEAVTLYRGDNREIAPLLGRFDLLLTDPPYGLGDRMKTGATSRWRNANDIVAWDQSAPDIAPFIAQADESIIWGGNYFGLPPSRRWFIWHKPDAMPSMGQCEMAWCSADGNTRQLSLSINSFRNERRHPTQKPLKLISWCLSFFPDAKTIFDPFAGAGTTGEAAKLLGKRAILIERDEEYCEFIAARLSQSILPLCGSAALRETPLLL